MEQIIIATVLRLHWQGLVRTAQVQPAIYFTLEAPFVRILGLYSNCLEDPGVISSQGGSQLDAFCGTLNSNPV
jgi:hypothetical protein